MKSPRPTLLASALGAWLALSAVTVEAAAVVSRPTFVVGSSVSSDDFHVAFMRDQSGLQTPYVDGVTDFDSYVAGNPLHDAVGPNIEWWSAPADITPWLLLGVAAQPISGIALWNADGNPAAMLSILGSVDGVAFEPLLLDQALDGGTVGVADGPQVFAWAPRHLAAIRLDFSCGPNQTFCGIGELALRAGGQVPEPATHALLGLAGLALMLGRARPRHRADAANQRTTGSLA